jgi:uncharacterized protein
LGTKASPKQGVYLFTNRKAKSQGSVRKKLPWEKGKEFKILSIDGGGIKGIFASHLLFLIEEQLSGAKIGEYFDLVAGTSTGGIIALAIGMGIPASKTNDLYQKEGKRIFPPYRKYTKAAERSYRNVYRAFRPYYDERILEEILVAQFAALTMGDSENRLIIPAFSTPKSEVAVFKTDHHSDYLRDWKTPAWVVARATSAAPTYFKGFEYEEYVYLDGGIWANNPTMLAIIEAISSYEIDISQIKVLSLGLGGEPVFISKSSSLKGSISWRYSFFISSYLSSDNVYQQAKLLLGNKSITRIDPETKSIDMDDWLSAFRILPKEADLKFRHYDEQISSFFQRKVSPRERYFSTP